MKTMVFTLFALALFSPSTFIAASSNQDFNKIKKVCPSQYRQLELTAAEVLTGRYPNAEDLNVSPACKEQARRAIQNWINEDMADWEKLSNQACSYALGWVEKVPGTCGAGGPPPLCPVDHWEQRPAEAEAKWNQLKAEVKAKRYAQILSAACGCYRAELESRVGSNVEATSKRGVESTAPIVAIPDNNTFILPCARPDDCPPGTACNGGVCRPLTESEQRMNAAKAKVIDFVKDQARDKAIETAIDWAKDKAYLKVITQFAESLVELSATMSFKIVTGVLEAPELATEKYQYELDLRYMQSRMKEIRELYDELANYKTGKPSRGPQMIEHDITELKSKLTNDMQMLGVSYDAIVRERQLGKDFCYEAFEFQHQRATQAIVNVLGLPNK